MKRKSFQSTATNFDDHAKKKIKKNKKSKIMTLTCLSIAFASRFQFHVSKIEIIDTKCTFFIFFLLLLVNGAEHIWESMCYFVFRFFQQLHRFIFGIESKDSQDERGTLSLSWQHLHESRYICHCLPSFRRRFDEGK